MKKRVSAVLAAVLAVSAFAAASSAAAATEFGSSCAAEGLEPGSLVGVSHGPSEPLPAAAPTSGVITRWTLTAGVEPQSTEEEEILSHLVRQTLTVLRPAGGFLYTPVGEAEGGLVNLHGPATYQARIPVQAGDLLGVGNGFALFCTTADAGDVSRFGTGGTKVGQTREFPNELTATLPPVRAVIEPDVDGDGYGDETQDKCPQSAEYQSACPVVIMSPAIAAAAAAPALRISSLPQVGNKALTLYVATSVTAPVSVTATVPLGKGRTATLSAATQAVAPGTFARFALPFTKPVSKALKKLRRGKSLRVAITASATGAAGAPATSAVTATLKGQAKKVGRAG